MIRPARISARTALAGLVAASVLGAGVALAVEHSGAAPSIGDVRAAAAAAASPSPSPAPGKHRTLSPRIGGFGGAGALGFAPGRLLGVLTKDTGLTIMQIVQDIQKGQTLDQIAGSHDSQVKADALAMVKKGLDAAVTKKVITSTQETSLLNDAKDVIDQLMAANLGNAGFKGLPGPGAFGGPFNGQHPNFKPAPGSSSSSSSSSNATS